MNVLESFKTFLKDAAAKAGVDITELRIEACTLDYTWGARCGLFFGGPLAERAATCFAKWATRARLGSSYNAQYALGPPQEFTRSVYRPTGNVSFTRGAFAEPEFDVLPGIAVPYVYYPCED